jgi:hypothetical protein
MARLESVSVAGYYPTPASLIPALAAPIAIEAEERYAFFDPCAGDGAAVLAFMERLYRRTYPDKTLAQLRDLVRLYAIEMEATRADALADAVSRAIGYTERSKVIHADAFRVQMERGPRKGIGLLYLNPPYDTDVQCGRLEERFLRRFTPALMDEGVLLFLVPFYALAYSAETLGREYSAVRCFKFPEPEWAAYKQVALYARKRLSPLREPDPAIVATVKQWAKDPSTIAVLSPECPVMATLPKQGWVTKTDYANRPRSERAAVGFEHFQALPFDAIAFAASYKPWHESPRGGKPQPIPLVLPDPAALTAGARQYPTVVPPRPAYIAAGIAAGVFNGERVEADDPASGAPPILVKGVFHKEFVTVEEKHKDDGTKTGEVQVQQPRLVVTVLDLQGHGLHTVKPTVEKSGSTDPAHMTTGDLLTFYGRSLLKVLRDHCPVKHDPQNPAHQIELPGLARPLYPAQAQAAMACVKELGGRHTATHRRRGKAVILLGEIGSGKTGVSSTAALAIGSRRPLVLCPPHLQESWPEQLAAIYPAAKVSILRSITDVEAYAEDKGPAVHFAILSREAAKLGHGHAGVGARCPKCGGPTPKKVDLAKKRARCELAPFRPGNVAADLYGELATAGLRAFPLDPLVAQGLPTWFLRTARERYEKATAPQLATYREALRDRLRGPVLDRLVEAAVLFRGDGYGERPLRRALEMVLVFLKDDAVTLRVAQRIFEGGLAVGGHDTHEILTFGLRLLHLVSRKNLAAQEALATDLLARPRPPAPSYMYDGTRDFWGYREYLHGDARSSTDTYRHRGTQIREGQIVHRERPMGDDGAFLDALEVLHKASRWYPSKPCGEPLYQAVPEPRRYPLATYLSRHYPDTFDCLLLDEGHEYATDGSAQERAAHRLVNLGKPTILLTGSIMQGYALSLYANWWSLFPEFREEFPRGSHGKFVDRYGYRKRFVQAVDKKSGEVVEYGTMSDRVEYREKDQGSAPGVLPLFILRYLLPHTVTLHKADLALSLPPVREIPVRLDPTPEQAHEHHALLKKLFTQVRQDRFTPLAGKLWGQVAEAPSHLDRMTADTGNTPTGDYEVRYPKSVGAGLVHKAPPVVSRDRLLPKEAWMLDVIEAEVNEGRPCLVFPWHVELLQRWARMIHARFGWKIPVLSPEKVPTLKRQSWITANVVESGAKVLVTNPVCVQTGLNNLRYFPTQVWGQNPICNPIIYRQGVGRSDRIGQDKEVRIYFPTYTGGMQVKAHSLLLHKVGVSQAVDGLDADSAFQAAGVGETGAVTGFSVGKELYKLFGESWS